MSNTKDRTGILIFLLLEDRKFYILADEGIHSKVDADVWNKIANEMSLHFSQKHFTDGIINSVKEIGAILSSNYPRKADDKNELPNQVIVN